MELTENPRAGGFILSEANRTRSRENIVVLSGENLKAGTVLGKISTSGKYVQLDPDASDGSESAAGILYAAVDASNGDAEGVAIVRDAEVIEDELIWPDNADTGDIDTAKATLTQLGIIIR